VSRPEVMKVELHVSDGMGNVVDWLDGKAMVSAIAMAERLGGRVERVTEFFPERETVWPLSEDEDDD
jgi:hypothetical protein